MLKVEHISTGYGKKQVLFDVSFETGEGNSALLIVGANGSGKSTLLKAIYGLLPLWQTEPFRGAIYFQGEEITGHPPFEMLKRGLLYIPQQNSLFEDLSVSDNLQMAGLTLKNRALLHERIKYVLDLFPSLNSIRKSIAMKLSGGERKILALAMAMLHNPGMIMLDEPFAGLSANNLELVRGHLVDLKEKQSVALLIVEHRWSEGREFADEIIGLKIGRKVYEEALDCEVDSNRLSNVFV